MEAVMTGFFGFFSIIFCCIYIAGILIGLFSLVFWLWMLIDLIQRKDNEFGPASSSDKKIIWFLLMFFTGVIGAIAYYVVIYKKFPRSS